MAPHTLPTPLSEWSIGQRRISLNDATYFMADIAANHDGDLERAKDLIWRAKEAGADAVKFQHFKAEKIVSDKGFRELNLASHQSKWGKPVFEVYRAAECNRSWTDALVQTAKDAKIDFLTAPYDFEALELLDAVLPAYKIGSGDITWTALITAIAQKGKPVMLATGAASMADVERAVATLLQHNRAIGLMQCNTNYTGSLENFHHVNLRVLQAYAVRFPGMVLGLSDHTLGHATVLGAIALGARIVEKHFTDSNDRPGPDHPFSMNPTSWREMIDRSRELEAALGTGVKQVEANEFETVILQQRCLRLTKDLPQGHVLRAEDVEALRPAPRGSILPYDEANVVGQPLLHDKQAGDALMATDVALGTGVLSPEKVLVGV